MAGESNRDIWQFIAGRSLIRPIELVEAELKRNKSKLLGGLSFYKKPSTPAGERLKHLKGLQLQCVQKINKFLNLDEVQSYELYCSFLVHDYRGSKKELKNVLSTERLLQSLIQKVRDYYFSERLYLLRCIKHLLSYWRDDHHPYMKAYSGFVSPLFGSGSTFIKDVVTQYKELCDMQAPTWETNGTLMNTRQASVWLHQNLKEQSELLQILFLYYREYEHPTDGLLVLANMFKNQGFGRRQTNKHLLDEVMEPILNRIGFMQVLLIIEGLDMEGLHDKGLDNQVAEHHVIKNLKAFNALDVVMSALGDSAHHGPVLLAWATIKQLYAGEEAAMQARKLGNKALSLRVFDYLATNLKAEPFSGGSMVGLVGKSVVYGFVYTVVDVFHEDTLGDVSTLHALLAQLLNSSVLADDFFTRTIGPGDGLSSLLLSAGAVFPHDTIPLLTLCTALGSASKSSALQSIAWLQRLPTFTEVLDRSTRLAPCDKRGVWQLMEDRHPYPHCPGAVVIPKGSMGQLVDPSGGGGGVDVMQWENEYNGWGAFVGEIDNLLAQVQHGADMVRASSVETVTEICRLLCAMLEQDVSMVTQAVPQLEQITQLLHQVIHRFSQIRPLPMDLIAASLEVLSHLVTKYPDDIWRSLQQTGFLPFLTENFDDLAEAASGSGLNSGTYGSILASEECTHGTYPVTLAFLQLVGNALQPLHSTEHSNWLNPCVLFITREIFPMFHKWRYYQVGMREKIVQKCLEVFHRTLNLLGPDKPAKPGSVNLRDLAVYSLMFTESGRTLLDIIGTGVDNIEVVLSSQGSLSEGAGIELIQLIRKAFSVLNRLLLLKDSGDHSSPVEHCLSAQPANLSHRHVVATIAQYMYHRHDPRLPRLATLMLKRLAMVFPMSILACLGNDADAIRDIFLTRLSATTEDVQLKVVIVELLSVCVDTQPGLIEIFLNLQPDNKDVTIGKSSCLQTMLALIEEKKQGSYECPSELLCSVLEFFHALWYGRRETAMAVLRQRAGFWPSVCLSLTRDLDRPSDDPSDLEAVVTETRTCAYILKILAHELYSIQGQRMDTTLSKVLQDLTKNRLVYWSKYLLSCMEHASKFDLKEGQSLGENGALELLMAWRNIVLVLAACKVEGVSLDGNTMRVILDHLLSGLETQLSGNDMGALQVKLSSITSAFYLTLLKHWVSHIEDWQGSVHQLENILSLTCSNSESLLPSVQIGVLGAILHILQYIRKKQIQDVKASSLSSLLHLTCSILQQNSYKLQPQKPAQPEVLGWDKMDVNVKLQISCVSLLEELVRSIGSVDRWLPVLKEHSMIQCLIAALQEWLQARQGLHYVQAMLLLLSTLAKSPPAAESVHMAGITQTLCLLLPQAIDSDAGASNTVTGDSSSVPSWSGIYQLSVGLMATMLNTLKYGFLQQLFDFQGVHQDRMTQCMESTGVVLSAQIQEEAAETCRFLSHLAHYRREWRLHMPQALNVHMSSVDGNGGCKGLLVPPSPYMPPLPAPWSTAQSMDVVGSLKSSLMLLTQRCVSLLIRPKLLHHLLQKKGSGVSGGEEMSPKNRLLMTPVARRLSQQGSVEDDSTPVHVLHVQHRLLEIVSWSITAQKQFSPDLCQILMDQSMDISEFEPLLVLGFSTPSVDQNSPPSFGTLISCTNMCLLMLNKGEQRSNSPGKKSIPEAGAPNKSSVILYVLETALLLLMSQAVLYLKATCLSPRDKQLLRRELGDELNSILDGIQRHFRRGATSPAPSPQNIKPPALPNEQPFFKLVKTFVTQVLR